MDAKEINAQFKGELSQRPTQDASAQTFEFAEGKKPSKNHQKRALIRNAAAQLDQLTDGDIRRIGLALVA